MVNQPEPEIILKKEIFENGLNLFYPFNKNGFKGTFSAIVIKWRMSNSKEEWEMGCAHLIEHLITLNLTRLIENEKIKAEVKGETSFAGITFKIEVKESMLFSSLAILARLSSSINSIFQKEDFEQERNAVLAEFELLKNDDRYVAEIMMNRHLVNKDHFMSAGLPGGIPEKVNELDLETLFNFFHSKFSFREINMIVAGNHGEPEEFMKEAKLALCH